MRAPRPHRPLYRDGLLLLLLGGLLLGWCSPRPLLAQSASGRINVTLTDARGAPVAGVLLTLHHETGAPVATCRTDRSGRCTLSVARAPTDASGLIRGWLDLGPHGQRPVIWPGGTLRLDLQLDPGATLPVPADRYVTRTPRPTRTPTPLPRWPSATPAGGAPPPASATPDPGAAAVEGALPTATAVPATSQGEATATALLAAPRALFLKLAALLAGLLGLLIFLPRWRRSP